MKLWKLLLCIVAFSTYIKADPNDIVKEGLTLEISQKSIDTIIYFESGDKRYYEKYLSRPTVPAWQSTSSGITCCFGADLGYMTKDQIRKAFTGVATEEEILLMQSVSGMKGKNAYYNYLPLVKYKLSFTWDQSMQVFKQYTLPSFTKQTSDAFVLSPTRLHPHSNGALLSILYNRGGSMVGDSRKEMRWIKYNISINREDRVPSDIISMCRLWDRRKLAGLWLRREAESKLFQEGLNSN